MGTVTSIARRHGVVYGGNSSLGEFPIALRVGDTLYMGSQHKPPKAGESEDIAARTHSAFSSMVATLSAAGLSMADLMKLHTYYVYEGEGTEVTKYWEGMTDVRLKYLADPGPAATALRVSASPTQKGLITIDGMASYAKDRQRLMPAHAWDWSIPTPFSQGWRVGNKVYVGGQISADRKGKAVAPWDVVEQTRNTLEFIRHVILEAGGTWEDLVALKIAYRHDGRDPEARKLLESILDIVRETLPKPGPALTCFGVDLLYEGLVLEIDGVAVIGAPRKDVADTSSRDWVSIPGFTGGTRVGDEIYIGGTAAPGAASLVAQTEAAMERVLRTLGAAEGRPEDLVKLNVYFKGDAANEANDLQQIVRIIGEYLPSNRPVLAVLRVPGLPHDGQSVQIDALAVVQQPE